MREVHDKPTAACLRAVRALEIAARKRGVAPEIAFKYRFTAAMLHRHLRAWRPAGSEAGRPDGVPAAAFVSTGGWA